MLLEAWVRHRHRRDEARSVRPAGSKGSEQRNQETHVNDKITKEPELKKLMCEHMETLLGVTDDEAKKLEEHNFENLTDIEMEKVRVGI